MIPWARAQIDLFFLHLFSLLVVMKMYANMTNIIVRLSCGPQCDENAVLLNAHYDTTLGSPGAVDDALPIGVMVELIRILSQRPALKKNSLIFRNNPFWPPEITTFLFVTTMEQMCMHSPPRLHCLNSLSNSVQRW